MYELRKQRHPILPSAGKYVARAFHNGVVDTEDVAREIQDNCSLKRADVLAVLSELEEVLCRHLQNGEIVRLNHLGRLKLEIRARPVERPELFSPTDHILGVALHFIPESRHSRQQLYSGINFVRRP